MSETVCKHQKIMKRTRKKLNNDQNLQSVTVKNEKKKKTENDTKRIKYMF